MRDFCSAFLLSATGRSVAVMMLMFVAVMYFGRQER
jgi:hypothetical protein